MLNKFIFIAGLSLSVFSIANASDLKESFTQIDKYNTESAMNIFKDAKNSNINSSNIDEFLINYDVGLDIKQEVKNLINKNVKIDDLKKLDYGLYQVGKVSSGIRHDHTCASIPGQGNKCAWKTDYLCNENPDGGC